MLPHTSPTTLYIPSFKWIIKEKHKEKTKDPPYENNKIKKTSIKRMIINFNLKFSSYSFIKLIFKWIFSNIPRTKTK